MSQQIDTSRRRALQFLAGAGLLPMASSLARASTMSLAPDGGGSSSSAALVVDSVSFTPMAAPTLADAAAMATTSVRSSMVVKYADGSSKTFALGYETFFVTGDMVPDGAGARRLPAAITISTETRSRMPTASSSIPTARTAPVCSASTIRRFPALPAMPCSVWCSSNTPAAMPPAIRCTASFLRRSRY